MRAAAPRRQRRPRARTGWPRARSWQHARSMDGTVLVVEDAPEVREVVRVLLERAGLQVAEAGDGRVALRLLFERRPDAVVLDVGLPELDGWTVLERIREVSSVPVLMLTAEDTEFDKVRALRGGA